MSPRWEAPAWAGSQQQRRHVAAVRGACVPGARCCRWRPAAGAGEAPRMVSADPTSREAVALALPAATEVRRHRQSLAGPRLLLAGPAQAAAEARQHSASHLFNIHQVLGPSMHAAMTGLVVHSGGGNACHVWRVAGQRQGPGARPAPRRRRACRRSHPPQRCAVAAIWQRAHAQAHQTPSVRCPPTPRLHGAASMKISHAQYRPCCT